MSAVGQAPLEEYGCGLSGGGRGPFGGDRLGGVDRGGRTLWSSVERADTHAEEP